MPQNGRGIINIKDPHYIAGKSTPASMHLNKPGTGSPDIKIAGHTLSKAVKDDHVKNVRIIREARFII